MSSSSRSIIPQIKDLSQLYADVPAAITRYERLRSTFEQTYDCSPDVYIRAPGRVNLIGEHIDYSGYSVLPMALEQDTVIAVSFDSGLYSKRSDVLSPEKEKSKSSLVFSNVKSTTYARRTFSNLDDAVAITPDIAAKLPPNLRWSAYLQCGLRGIVEEVEKNLSYDRREIEALLQPCALLVDGVVPPSAGLSSSSSLVCASALLMAQRLTSSLSSSAISTLSTPAYLAEVCRGCEQYIGTAGGGMDQAISFLSTRAAARRIDFSPLASQAVHLPKNAAFVVANTLYESDKAQNATKYFNCRALECKLAAFVLAAHFDLYDLFPLTPKVTLKQVQEKSGKSLTELATYLEKERPSTLHFHPYTIAEVEKIINDYSNARAGKPRSNSSPAKPPAVGGVAETVRLAEIFADNENLLAVVQEGESGGFHLYERAIHVFNEAARVIQFQRVCDEHAAGQRGEEETLKELGKLMNASHVSCDRLYDCSCPDLNKLVDLALDCGAIGARLTGAGWGGAIVALLRAEDAARFVKKVRDDYYVYYKGLNGLEFSQRIDASIFITAPGAGAAVVDGNIVESRPRGASAIVPETPPQPAVNAKMLRSPNPDALTLTASPQRTPAPSSAAAALIPPADLSAEFDSVAGDAMSGNSGHVGSLSSSTALSGADASMAADSKHGKSEVSVSALSLTTSSTGSVGKVGRSVGDGSAELAVEVSAATVLSSHVGVRSKVDAGDSLSSWLNYKTLLAVAALHAVIGGLSFVGWKTRKF